jgi:hypothetical protein
MKHIIEDNSFKNGFSLKVLIAIDPNLPVAILCLADILRVGAESKSN